MGRREVSACSNIDRNAGALHRAARLALRGHGHVEPNPMVGCIIVDARGEIIGMGHHERFGGPHAEINALRTAGERARGGTMYITLEPCSHHGKTPPCTDAIIRAGIANVVIAQRDSSVDAGGGAARLESAGIAVEFNDGSALASSVSAPFRHRMLSGLPWVIAKIALTADGRMVTHRDEPRWITGEASRRLVHRQRGRVDAIITGVGTVLADDPLLTPRNVSTRRMPLRIVVDSDLRAPINSRLVTSAREWPLIVTCTEQSQSNDRSRVDALRDRGVHVMEIPGRPERVDLRELLVRLASDRKVATAMLEAGPRLLSAFAREQLFQQAWVFVGGGACHRDRSTATAQGFLRNLVGDRRQLSLQWLARRGADTHALYRLD